MDAAPLRPAAPRAPSPGERYNEWDVGVERALRLPGKAELDRQLGAAGIASAKISRGDALHEASRGLLAGWFDWLRERPPPTSGAASATSWPARPAW
jgi:hypothetical protein